MLLLWSSFEQSPTRTDPVNRCPRLLICSAPGVRGIFAQPFPHKNEGASSLSSSNPVPVASPATPPTQRLEPTGWFNLRSALGLLLVLVAVFAGTLVLQRAQHLVPVYAAARDLPSGVTLSGGDLAVVQVRLPAAELRRYLRPSPSRPVRGAVLTAPLRQHMLVPTDRLAPSLEQAGMVELPIKVDHGDMAQGLRPGDHVQVLAAYSDGLHSGRAQVLVESVEVVRILEEPGGLAGGSRESGVQVRLPSERTAVVAAAIAGARVFVVKAPPLPSGSSAAAEAPAEPVEPDLPGGSP